MELNTVSTYMSESSTVYQSSKSSKSSKKESTTETTTKESAAYVVEKSTSETKASYTKNSSKVDTATIEKLKQEAEEKTAQLRTMVEKLILKQSKTFDSSLDIYDIIKSGELEVDEETRLQAQKDVAEDGYWGVEQTSERLLSFAVALAGDDPDKIDAMVEAFKKGYGQAEEKWGGELPDICQKTYDAFLEKVEEWKKSKNSCEEQ